MENTKEMGSYALNSAFPKWCALENTVLSITLLIALGAAGLLSAPRSSSAGDLQVTWVPSEGVNTFPYELIKIVSGRLSVAVGGVVATRQQFIGSDDTSELNAIVPLRTPHPRFVTQHQGSL